MTSTSVERLGARPSWRAMVMTARPRQWMKNALVFAAPAAAGRLFEHDVALRAATMAVAFILGAVATYFMNDVADAEGDRAHPTKCHRPIASGLLSPRTALVTAALAAAGSVALAMSLSLGCAAVMALYLALTAAYSTWLKDQPILDVACVAAGFVLRAVAGAVAVEVTPSPWFLLVAGAASLFMVAGRRHGELVVMGEERASTTRRSLQEYSLPFVRFLWTVSAATTVCAYSLWAVEEGQLRPHPGLYQLTVVPFVLAILRYALQIDRGNGGSPEDVVLSDRVLQAMAATWVVLFVIASELSF